MKGPIVPILVVALILGGAYYYFFVMKRVKTEPQEPTVDKKPEPERLIGNMFAPDHSSEAIAAMFSGDEWRKQHPILI